MFFRLNQVNTLLIGQQNKNTAITAGRIVRSNSQITKSLSNVENVLTTIVPISGPGSAAVNAIEIRNSQPTLVERLANHANKIATTNSKIAEADAINVDQIISLWLFVRMFEIACVKCESEYPGVGLPSID